MLSKIFLVFAALFFVSGISETSALPMKTGFLVGTAAATAALLAAGATEKNDQGNIIENYDPEMVCKFPDNMNSVDNYRQIFLGDTNFFENEGNIKKNANDPQLDYEYTASDWNAISIDKGDKKNEDGNSDSSNLQNKKKITYSEYIPLMIARFNRNDYERQLGMHPTHSAVKHGDISKIQSLLNLGADFEDWDYTGLTPLHYAVIYYRSEIMDLLIDNGVKIHEKTEDGLTPFHYAVAHGNTHAFKTLIEKGANINEKTIYGLTPMHYAAINGNLEVLNFLIEKGANIDEKDNDGLTPLYYAAKYGHLEVLNFLIEKSANIDEKDNNGLTPLYYAAKYGHLKVLNFLIEKGANVNSATRHGNTPLHYATKFNHLDIIKALIRANADVNQINVYGKNPFNYAATSEICHLLLDEIEKKQKAGGKESSFPWISRAWCSLWRAPALRF